VARWKVPLVRLPAEFRSDRAAATTTRLSLREEKRSLPRRDQRNRRTIIRGTVRNTPTKQAFNRVKHGGNRPPTDLDIRDASIEQVTADAGA